LAEEDTGRILFEQTSFIVLKNLDIGSCVGVVPTQDFWFENYFPC